MVGEPGIMKEKAELMPTITTQATFRGRSRLHQGEGEHGRQERPGLDAHKAADGHEDSQAEHGKLVPNLLMSMRPSTTSEPVPIIQALNMPPNMKAINRLVQ